MSKRDLVLLLEDILDAAEKIKRYTRGMSFDDFVADDKTVDAVVRNFEIIGKAANRIDNSFKENNPNLEWSRLRGFRNRIVHDYFGIDYEIVWSIINKDLDGYRISIEQLLENEQNFLGYNS